MNRLRAFLRAHGETLILGMFFALALVIALGVIGPSLDRYDVEHAHTAQR